MDDLTIILQRMLGAATGGMLRIGLVALLAFLALINMAAVPAAIAVWLSWFFAAVLVISLTTMLYLGLKSSLSAEPQKLPPPAPMPSPRELEQKLPDVRLEEDEIGELEFSDEGKSEVV